MQRHSRFLLGTIPIALILATVVSTASATRLNINSQSFKITWSEARPVSFANEEGSIVLRCPITLEGTFHSRSISKVSGELIGFANRAVFAEARCTGGALRVLAATLPWHVRYDSFTGTLPTFTGLRIQLIGLAFLLEIFGQTCLYATSATEPMVFRASVEVGGTATSLEPLPERSIRKISGGILCATRLRFSGASATVTQASGTALTIRLIR